MAIVFGVTFEKRQEYETVLVQKMSLGDSLDGSGNLVCRNGGIAWVVAPESTEVTTTWNNMEDAVCNATSNAKCRDWFVPTVGDLENPGYVCRTNWDSYSSSFYWSKTEHDSNHAYAVNFLNGTRCLASKTNAYRVRAFRCVAY